MGLRRRWSVQCVGLDLHDGLGVTFEHVELRQLPLEQGAECGDVRRELPRRRLRPLPHLPLVHAWHDPRCARPRPAPRGSRPRPRARPPASASARSCCAAMSASFMARSRSRNARSCSWHCACRSSSWIRSRSSRSSSSATRSRKASTSSRSKPRNAEPNCWPAHLIGRQLEVRLRHVRSPNRTVPSRTSVAPSSTAIG